MITIDQAANIFQELSRQEIKSLARTAARISSNDGLAMIVVRLQQGKDNAGNYFKGYSDAKVPLFFYAGKSRTGSDAANKRLKTQVAPSSLASYKDWRIANNLQVEHKDFTFTGRMMNSLKSTIHSEGRGFITMEINSNTANEKQKIEHLSATHGNLLEMSKSERDKTMETFGEMLVQEFENAFS